MSSDDEKPVNKINIQDIVPRKDITQYVTDALINEFSDRDWKVMEYKEILSYFIYKIQFLIGFLTGSF